MRERTRPEQPTIDLREQLSQRNKSLNSNNSARFFRKEDERPLFIERPLTSSTPAPCQRTPEMNLADIIESHKKNVHGPTKKGRRSYIPSQEQAREEDERRFGGKWENEERIRRNRKKNEQRLKELEIEKLKEESERKKWEWASTIRTPPPRRADNRCGPTEILYLDGRREVSPAETFGGPRREQHQRPGTSTGSRPSSRRLFGLPNSSTTI